MKQSAKETPSKAEKKSTRQHAEKRGRKAEVLAATLLRLKGYKILAKRFSSSAGEIDLIVQKGEWVAFVEVKTRKDTQTALESITPKQRHRIENAAQLWLQQNASQNFAVRFDVITVAHGKLPAHMMDAWRPGW